MIISKDNLQASPRLITSEDNLQDHLHLNMEGTNPLTMWEGHINYILNMEGTNPVTMLEGLTDSSLPLGRNLDLENTKILHEVLKLHSG